MGTAMSNDLPPSRILEIAPDQLSDQQKAGIAALLKGRGRLLAPYKVWLYSPTLMQAMEQLGTFLNKQSSLSEREVELGICLIAQHWMGEYVFAAHAKRCLELGVPPAAIDAIRRNEPPALDSPRERAICEIARVAQEPGPGPDASFDGALDALGREGLAETLCLFGYYSAVAIAMKLHRVPIPVAK
jgi:4-carboxymuconolactone decarboxylase